MAGTRIILGLLTAILAGCATVPREVQLPILGVRVVSFSMERSVRVGDLNGPAESKPGILLSASEAFETPLLETIEKLWQEFPEQAAELLGSTWVGPGDSTGHPHWLEQTREPISSLSLDWSRARGFYWPEGFRFLDRDNTQVASLTTDFPGQLLLAVEYTLFVQDVGSANAFGFPSFRMGLAATLRLYGTDGNLLSRSEVVGYSIDSVPRIGMAPNRARYADLAVQAQADVLARWARLVHFSAETPTP